MKNHSLKILVLSVSLLIANGILQWMVDDDLGISWMQNVLRNWEQSGFLALKGQMVQNPGGHGAVDHPDIYPGHRPSVLYPAYIIHQLFAWTGSNTLPYHILFSAATLLAIWWLLGRTDRALMLGGLAILTPGYLVFHTILDPNAVAILAGIPFMALLWWQLTRPLLKPANIVFLALLTFAYTSLNWTTALVHAQLFLALLIVRAVSFRRLIIYFVLAAASAAMVVVIGLLAKMSEPFRGHGAGAFGQLLAAYLWGNNGYSDGSATLDLLVRLAFINALGLFPLWLVLAGTWFRSYRGGSKPAWLALGPLCLGICEALVMRNYFTHHPWMAAPLFLVGWVLTMKILEAPGNAPAPARAPLEGSRVASPAWAAGLIAAFAFGAAVLLLNRINASQLYSLVALVRGETKRSDQIVVVESRDPQLVELANRLEENLDRQVALTDSLPAPENSPSGAVLLSAVPMGEGWRESGRTKAGNSLPFINSVLEWFTKNISRRKAGDKMELADTYYLYYADPPTKFKPASESRVVATNADASKPAAAP